ncbi:MAG: hypothetical protein K9H25_18190 [Rhodospirillum sp.]|nr:hypothetical protein [Rhodospirillum sp.]MCF8490828.1 hypothetical protein [Rhodospirillum sp.]MCF8501387.1 hypothetical protein [Rhodospirillum sp.]
MALRTLFLTLILFLPMALPMALPGLAAEDGTGTKPLGAEVVAPSRMAEIVVNAMPLAPYDSTRPILARVMDDSAANLAILDSLKAALVARGVPLAKGMDDEAVLLLDLDTSATSAVTRPDPSGAPFAVSGVAGTSDDEDSVDVTVRVYSNVQGSVLGGDRDAAKPSLGGPDLRLDLGLTDPQGGRRLWQGWGTVSAPALGIAGQGLLLTDPLAAALGKSVIKQVIPVELDQPARP